jgi:putative mRNA 3-end processing factor
MNPPFRLDLVQVTDGGPSCYAGDFFVDPWESVDRALITHAHADHTRAGSQHYPRASPGVRVRALLEQATDTP